MRRRMVTAVTALVAATVALSLVPAAAPARPLSEGPSTVDARPNFVIIQTDDMTVEDLSVMPRVRQLITDQGASFSRMMTPFAICCPSRAAMMTGCYPHNNGINGNFPPDGGFVKWERGSGDRMVASWLQAAGYYTAHIGKYINGYAFGNRRNVPVPKGWTEWRGSTDPSTYQMWGYRLNEPEGSRRYGVFNVENPAVYSTDVYGRKAARIVRQQAANPGPFLLQVAFLAPHVETVPIKQALNPRDVDVDDPGEDSPITSIAPRPAPRHKKALRNVELVTDPSFNEADVSDKQAFIRDLPVLTDDDIAELEDYNRKRKQSLLSVDEAVGGIIRALDETAQSANTYVIFVGDNGYMLGQHRIKKGKYFPYEPSLTIPMSMRGPGIPAGTVVTGMTTLMDIAPTLLDLAGVAPTGREPDGLSLMPMLRDGAALPARTLLLSSGPQQAPNGDDLPRFDGVRTTDYAWWRYNDGFEELYDLRNDPYQVSSVASDPRYAATRDALVAEWERMRVCAGASCRTATPTIPGPSG